MARSEMFTGLEDPTPGRVSAPCYMFVLYLMAQPFRRLYNRHINGSVKIFPFGVISTTTDGMGLLRLLSFFQTFRIRTSFGGHEGGGT